MRPWIIDASEIVDASEMEADSDELYGRLLHSNTITDQYLSSDNTSSLILVATKGYGKTFLLQAKRLRLESLRETTRPGLILIPSNALIDRPIAAPPILSSESIANMLTTADYWKNVWLITLICATLKRHNFHGDVKTGMLKALFSGRLQSIFDIFTQIIQLGKRDIFSCYEDLQKNLIPDYRNLHSPTYLFLDNVDEYFQTFISSSKNLAFVGERDPIIWSLAQLGLAIAARELYNINPHVKVCASIRKEALSSAHRFGDTMPQVRARLLEIRYSRHDLIEIMRKNISAEPSSKLVSPNATDELERFFGSNNRCLFHPRTKEKEAIEDYVHRHTLGRPRDVCWIGRNISSIPPDRRSPEAIAGAVNEAARQIFEDYIGEVQPHINDFDIEILRRLVPANILTPDQIQSISLEYDREWEAQGNAIPSEGCHVFCNLYRLGLLGIIIQDRRTNVRRQQFAVAGEIDLRKRSVLPESSSYLIHPLLDSTMAAHSQSYWESFDKVNIVGNDRVWRSEKEFYFVVRGDVIDSHIVADDPLEMQRFKKFFQDEITKIAKPLDYHEVSQGDSVLLMDKNPLVIWDAVRRIAGVLRGSDWNMSMRFGGDSGLILFQKPKKMAKNTSQVEGV